jgi:Dyp-type peroxidase family
MTALEVSDIQGIVLFGYGAHRWSRYLHVSFESEGVGDRAEPAAWLAEIRHEVHGAARGKPRHDERVNVAFTHLGLKLFSLEGGELASFPRELQQGMHDELRAHVNGDVGANAPETWVFGGPKNDPVHALIMMFAKTEDAARALRDRLVARVGAFGGTVVHEDESVLPLQLREPFGFRDGIAQPRVAGSPRTSKNRGAAEVPAGEFILGYPNAYGECPPSPHGTDGFDIGKNGTYLVYRKLRQDTAGFWRDMLARAQPAGDSRAATKLASSLVGRWPSGAPLVKYPDFDPGPGAATEEFGFFDHDRDGTKCPLGAHIRRANPRDMLSPAPDKSLEAVTRHRLLRRGRPYGPEPTGTTPLERSRPDGHERGLVFVAINASLRRQFEFVQQTWINNPKFGGLYDERDPLVSTAVSEGGQHYSIPTAPARRRLGGLVPFVTVRGGGYFFVPGLRALEWLARRGAASRS